MRNNNSCLTALLIVAISVPVIFLLNIYYGWALMVMWSWFMAPTFGLPTLTIWQAMGISAIIAYMAASSVPKQEDVGRAISILLLRPIVLVFYGWVTTWFM